jgi:hypothetical protein
MSLDVCTVAGTRQRNNWIDRLRAGTCNEAKEKVLLINDVLGTIFDKNNLYTC